MVEPGFEPTRLRPKLRPSLRRAWFQVSIPEMVAVTVSDF